MFSLLRPLLFLLGLDLLGEVLVLCFQGGNQRFLAQGLVHQLHIVHLYLLYHLSLTLHLLAHHVFLTLESLNNLFLLVQRPRKL